MKKLFALMAALIGLGLGFTGCSDDTGGGEMWYVIETGYTTQAKCQEVKAELEKDGITQVDVYNLKNKLGNANLEKIGIRESGLKAGFMEMGATEEQAKTDIAKLKKNGNWISFIKQSDGSIMWVYADKAGTGKQPIY